MEIHLNHPKQAVCMNQVGENVIDISDALGFISRSDFS